VTEDVIRRIVLNLVPMVLSLSVHEFAHAWVADRLGDDTPRRQGRLTLSPLEHYDIFGTIIIPVVGAMFGGFSYIGWARPVEVSPGNLSRRFSMRSGMSIVALAGPLSNLLLAMFAINVGLFVFNLLPIPPLDGSRLLPRSLDRVQEMLAPMSILILLLILYSNTLRSLLIETPVDFVGGGLVRLFGLTGGVS
jgi:Zn-dependent protease